MAYPRGPLNDSYDVVVRPTITNGAYSANDVVGGLLQVAVPSFGGGGVLREIIIADLKNIKAALNIYLFRSLPSNFLDNAPFAVTDNDALLIRNKISVVAGDYETYNTRAWAIKPNLNLNYIPDASGVLFAHVVCVGTPTYTSTNGLQFTFGFWRD